MKFLNVIITLLLISNSWAATVLPIGNTNGSTKIFAATNSNVSIVTAGTGVTKVSNNLRLTDGTETLPSAGINTQANTSLINFGINDQGSVLGTYNSANQGGMFRVDARAAQPLYTWYGQPASSAQATLMTLTNAGLVTIKDKVLAGSSSAISMSVSENAASPLQSVLNGSVKGGLFLTNFNIGGYSPRQTFFYPHNATIGTTYGAIPNGYELGRIDFWAAYNTASTAEGARISVSATETWTGSTVAGTQLEFYTRPNSGAATVLALKLGQDQSTTFAGNLFFSKSTETLFSANTSDGSDNKRIIITGGGNNGASRGASLELAGNENGDAGAAYLMSGTSAAITMAPGGTPVMTMNNAVNGVQVQGGYNLLVGSTSNYYLSMHNYVSTGWARLAAGAIGQATNDTYANSSQAVSRINFESGDQYFDAAAAGTINNVISWNRNASFENNGVVRFNRISTTGNAANAYLDSGAGNSLLRSTSSRRYKSNISPLEVDSSLVYNLQPVSYKSLASADDPNKRFFGLIAEDVAEVLPSLVVFTKEKSVVPGSVSEDLIPDSVQYERISILLLEEMKKLKTKLDKVCTAQPSLCL